MDIDVEGEIEKAVGLARDAEQVIICAGLNADWETEGHDREGMDLPGMMDELIARVAEAAPGRTVVVMQCGTPVHDDLRLRSGAALIVDAIYIIASKERLDVYQIEPCFRVRTVLALLPNRGLFCTEASLLCHKPCCERLTDDSISKYNETRRRRRVPRCRD